jgi:hypothetical protein
MPTKRLNAAQRQALWLTHQQQQLDLINQLRGCIVQLMRIHGVTCGCAACAEGRVLLRSPLPMLSQDALIVPAADPSGALPRASMAWPTPPSDAAYDRFARLLQQTPPARPGEEGPLG